jgi:hypothetical protein
MIGPGIGPAIGAGIGGGIGTGIGTGIGPGIGGVKTRRRGSPLAAFGLLIAVWIAGRAVLWESPFQPGNLQLPGAELLFADSDGAARDKFFEDDTTARSSLILPGARAALGQGQAREAGMAFLTRTTAGVKESRSSNIIAAADTSGMSAAHQLQWLAGTEADQNSKDAGEPTAYGVITPPRRSPVSPVAPPRASPAENADRWSLDAWAFWREGSGAAPISQGRVPIYGASQIGANLQYRVDPGSARDPRIYVRAYRAMVTNGENELAGGVSARPIGQVPVRIAAELRATDNAFGTELRPAAYAVTELAPLDLPARFTMEAYGGAGYVGGDAATPFVDGQVAVAREMATFDGPSRRAARLSFGVGAWGGAQEGASRLDVGPSIRIDLSIGDVPARFSIDWREQVAGDAAPNSGLAATLSTRF